MLSHVNNKSLPEMVDISGKPLIRRSARARTTMQLDAEIIAHFQGQEIHSPKGAVFATAIIAGTQAVKETARLIPLCHTIPISSCSIAIEVKDKDKVQITCNVQSNAATGVEMEAIVGSSIAAITIYDMCKSISSNMHIAETRLLEKRKAE